LVDRHPGLKIVAIGKGDAEIERLKTLARSLGVADRLVLPGPIYEEQRLAPWFLSSDVFCYPANIGLSILHAFGYGLPTITSDRVEAQNPEIEALQPGVNGLTYTDGDSHALTQVLDDLLSDESRTQQMAEQAHLTATEKFTLQNMVDGFESAVHYCVGRSG
jgi:glycosyltransferase involved in cell wall biosynthesis